MTGKMARLVCSACLCFAYAIGSFPRSAGALDTPNTLLGIDGLVLQGAGLFRDPGSFPSANGNDGFNTFQFGSFEIQPTITTGLGKYDAIRFRKTATGDCCISHNSRFNSNTPETIPDPIGNPTGVSNIGDSITSDFFPIIDRAAFGQRFDPSEYQIQVKFKPLLTQATATSLGVNPYPGNPTYPNIPATLENTAPLFTVGIDQLGGYVWDAELSTYKRAGEQVIYNIGSGGGDFNNNGTVDAADYVVLRENDTANVALPNDNGLVTQAGREGLWRGNFGSTALNQWYASAPKDADGFATWSVPVTSPSFLQRTFYYSFGSGDFRTNFVLTNGGKADPEMDGTFVDVTNGYGPNFSQFGGGPSEPGNPGSKLNVPNGVTVMALGAPSATLGLSLEIKSVALTRITPGPIVARLDANSGISFRFGSGFTYGATQPPINVNGTDYIPLATDQISRFDQNGMTNLMLDMRTPDDPNEVHRFIIRGAPNPSTFDATGAVVNVRAKLLQPLTDPGVAQSLTLVAKARKGNDDAPEMGADEWNFVLDLNQFNTSSMTTVSIPLSMFTRNMMSSTLGPPLGFANFGDGLLTDFGLYEFGGLIPAGGGLLRLELEYMEMRLPGGSAALVASGTVPEPATCLLTAIAAAFLGLRRRRVT